MSAFERTALLLGEDAVITFAAKHVAVFGVGGVGSYAVEALARAGIGQLTLLDNDIVSQSNINRQLVATIDTVGQLKVEVAKKRVLSINPDAKVTALAMFYLPENADELDIANFDYIIDAIDTMSAKIELILRAKAADIPIISAMGCGNKLDPTKFCVADLSETSGDPVARVLRRELKQRGITHLKVVYSTEPPMKPLGGNVIGEPKAKEQSSPNFGTPARKSSRRATPGSVSFVPSVAGLIMAGEAIKDLVSK